MDEPKDRPSWDRAIYKTNPILPVSVGPDGRLRADVEITEEEIKAERIRRAKENALELAHATMRDVNATFLADAHNRETAHRANLEALGDVTLTFEDRPKQIAHHLYELAKALYQQGRFDEALEVAANEEQAEWIKKLKEAVERPDDHDCGCLRDHGQSRRFEREYIYSPIHGQVAGVKECAHCGLLNVFPGKTAHQEKIAEMRARAPKVTDDAIMRELAK